MEWEEVIKRPFPSCGERSPLSGEVLITTLNVMEQTFPTDAQTVETLCARNPPWKLNRESRACARHNNSDREGRCSSFLEMFHESKEAGDRHPNVADLLLAQPDVSAGPCIWKHSPKQTQEAPVLAGTIH